MLSPTTVKALKPPAGALEEASFTASPAEPPLDHSSQVPSSVQPVANSRSPATVAAGAKPELAQGAPNPKGKVPAPVPSVRHTPTSGASFVAKMFCERKKKK